MSWDDFLDDDDASDDTSEESSSSLSGIMCLAPAKFLSSFRYVQARNIHELYPSLEWRVNRLFFQEEW